MPSIIITNASGSYRVDEIVTAIRWAGDVRQCARTLVFEMLADGPDCPVGTAVSLSEDGTPIFSGFVFDRSRVTTGNTISLTCYDPGFYLKRNQTSAQYQKVTPETAVAALCSKYGLQVAGLVQTGVAVSRIFLQSTLYQIIGTLYTLASKQTGVPYQISFDGLGRLQVEEKVQKEGVGLLLLQPGSNLMDATVSENGEEIVNRVEVISDGGATLYTKDNQQSMETYGVLQTVLKNGTDTPKEVEALLKMGEPEQKITVNCLGDIRCTAGQPVMLQEPVTGLRGLFWIDSDTHQWRGGIHTAKLVLTLESVMQEQTAGK